MSRICVFIPTYNVETSILAVLSALDENLLSKVDAVLLVDNGSTDRTIPYVLSFMKSRSSPKFHLLKNRENYTLGGSTIVAFDWALAREYDYLICLHSDGQADPRELEKFFPHCDGKNDFVLGSRMMAESRVAEYSWVRLVGNKFFAFCQRWITGAEIDDIGAFIAFRLQTVCELPYNRLPYDMGYQPLLVLSAFSRRENVRFVNLPISWGAVDQSSVNPIIYGIRHLYRLLRISIQARALELPGVLELKSDICEP